MIPRARLLETLRFSRIGPPRFESEFSDDVVRIWREEGRLGDSSPERYFNLDTFGYLPLEFRLDRERSPVVKTKDDLESFKQSFLDLRNKPFPDNWNEFGREHRDDVLAAAVWDEGFFQILGIRNGATLNEALCAVCEAPDLAKEQMAFYAQYLEDVMHDVLSGLPIDFAVYYEPIASNHGSVISPEMYRCFVQPALTRIVASMTKHGVKHHFMWSAGNVKPLIPLWLDSGINGFILNRGSECGIRYADLRKEFGPDIRLFGGIGWRAVVEGGAALRAELEKSVRPLLDRGGYVPFLDDTVRSYMPFDRFQEYRRMLDELIDVSGHSAEST